MSVSILKSPAAQSIAENPGAMFARAVCYSGARAGAEPVLTVVPPSKSKAQKAPPPPAIQVVDILTDSHWHKPYLRVCHGNHNAAEVLGKLVFRYQRTPDGQPRLNVIRKSAEGQPCFWFYHTRQELADECGLTLDQVRYAIAKLRDDLKLIETRVNGAKVKGQKKSLFRLLVAEGAGSLNGWPAFETPPAIGENSPIAGLPCEAEGDSELSGEIPLSAIGENSPTAIGENSPIKAFKGVGSKGVGMKGVSTGVPPQGIQAQPDLDPDPGTTNPTPTPDTSPEVSEPAGWFVKPEKKLTKAELLARDEAWLAEHPLPVVSLESEPVMPMAEPAVCAGDPEPQQAVQEAVLSNGAPAEDDPNCPPSSPYSDSEFIARWLAAQPKPEPKPVKKMTCTA